MRLFFASTVILICLYGCNNNPNPPINDITDSATVTPVINYAVTKFFPHDTTLYTEGFLIHDGQLFESTGSPEDRPQTKSVIGIIDLATGTMDKKVEIDKSKYFGEGIVILNDKLYQLTYTTQVGFIYDIKSFKQVGKFSFANKQGWSLTTNDKEQIMSDGTDKRTVLASVRLIRVNVVPVTENATPVKNLQELEVIKGIL